MRLSACLAVLACVGQTLAVASTDEYRDADIGQSSYLPNHNMDPNIVNSASFGLQWKVAFNTNEQFYAKPLTYTPLAGGSQLLFLASNMNYIRTLNAKTGAIINSRQVHTPFLQSDIGCYDMPNYIGIAGTPTIDPATDIVYFFSKTYIPNYRVSGNTGTSNGVYYFHGVNINTLADVFTPILIDGSVADNDPQKYFVGGVILQRPSLVQVGNMVYGAFGGHCDLFNYTGTIIGININTAKIVTNYAMESGPLSPQTNSLLQNGGGGEAGIWMSGMGIASDGNRIFVVTGNGDSHQNQGTPASGSSPLATLGQAALNFAVNTATGILSLIDYFQPFDYSNLDGNDQDFGSGGIVLLDPTVFSGGGVDKMAVTAGKSGKIYVLNANNLGGYRLGTGQTDNVIQTIATGESVFGAAGSYPGEGGYIYFTPVGYATYAYQLGFTASGTPQFTEVAKTNEISAGRVGVGTPTITSLNGQAGTAILWMTDPDAGLRAWYAVPNNGILTTIPLPTIGGANKFQRPAFGDGMVYTTDSNGVLYCLGSPVNLPLNCTSPVQFGSLAVGSKSTQTINCTANIAITSVVGLTITSGNYFSASNSSLPTGALKAGQSFSFPVTWDLTNAASSSPGIKSTPLTMMTTNGVTNYATSFPIGLMGTEVSNAPYLDVSPNTVDFGGIVVTNTSGVQTESGAFSIANQGQGAMQIVGYAYTNANKSVFTNCTVVNGTWDLGNGFTAATLPAIGSSIAGNTAVSVDAVFTPVNGVGDYVSFWQIWTNGGTENIILEGTASTSPIANFSISNEEGGWLPQTNLLMDFGAVAPGDSGSRQIRICNNGGSSLEIDKSKPPNGVFRISDPTELEETLQIVPGGCAYGTVLMTMPYEEENIPDILENNTWTLNTNDLTWGVHVVEITATLVSTKVGPLNSTTGLPIYNYLGCFAESTTGPRLFPNEPLAASNTNDNAVCQTGCYNAKQYWFAGTEYGDECWCGNTPPPLANQDTTDTMCNFACPGNGSDSCGASGYVSVYYNPLKYTKGTDPANYGPQTPATVGSYSYQGCYSEATTGRALSGLSPTAPTGGFTLELCAAACKGYTYWGMEYSNQCYCGNSLGAGSVNQTSSVPATNGCSMTCTGNSLEYCGGSSRLNLYQLNSSIVTSSSTSSSVVLSSTSSTSVQSGSSGLSTQTRSSSSISVSTTSATTTTSSTLTGPVTVTKLAGWNYLGCWTEATNGRALSGKLLPITAANTNIENCAAACSGYTYFGVEYSQECYCGKTINAGSVNTSTVANPNSCNMVCADNAYEYCGGRSVLNLYQVAPVVSSSSSVSTVISSTTSTISSILSSSSSVQSSLSLSSTTSTSSILSSSFSSSSVESSSSVPTVVSSTASTSSSLSSSSSPTLGLKQNVGSYSYLGCYTEATNVRALSAHVYYNYTAMTLEMCAVDCVGYKYFGVEYGGECYCGNVINTGSVLAIKQTDCSFTCPGNAYEYCGAGNRLEMYQLGAVVSSSSSLTSTTSSSTPVVSSSSSSALSTSSSMPATSTASPQAVLVSSSVLGTSSTPSITSTSSLLPSSSSVQSTSSMTSTSSGALPSWTGTLAVSQNIGNWSYLGCATEVSGRTLTGSSYSGNGMTIESCQSFCTSNNYAIAGLEYSSQCYCSNTLASPSLLGQTGCTMTCTGNTGEYCGGSSRISVFNNTAYVYPSNLQSANGYNYQGCYAEGTNGRLLGQYSYSDSKAMTVESCTAFCKSNIPSGGYAGVEYGSQCYCSATLPQTAVIEPVGSCSMLCSGNNKEFCGNTNMLNVYYYPTTSTTPTTGSKNKVRDLRGRAVF